MKTEDEKAKDRELKRERKALEMQTARAELRSAEAAAIQAEAEATSAKLESEHQARTWKKVLATDEYSHILRFTGPLEESSVGDAILRLSIWSRLEPGCDITVIFCSPGGEAIPGMALFDFLLELRAKGHSVTTVASGYAASMAGILLQAGTHRVMGREAYLLIHEVQGAVLGSYGELTDRMVWLDKLQDRILDIFAERSTVSKDTIRERWGRKDWWLDSKEALELGFVDEVR